MLSASVWILWYCKKPGGYWLIGYRSKKVKVLVCIAHLVYKASNALFVTNPSRRSGRLGSPTQLY